MLTIVFVLLPETLFLIVILQLAWLVSSLKGVKSSSKVLLASILTVCHCNCLKISKVSKSGCFNLVILKSAADQSGERDSTRIRHIYKKTYDKLQNDMIQCIIWLLDQPVQMLQKQEI